MFGMLSVIAGADRGKTFTVAQGQTLVLGKTSGALGELTDPTIVSGHCEVSVEAQSARVRTSGTGAEVRVNNVSVVDHLLESGDVIGIGETEIRFEWSWIDEQPTLAPPGLIPFRPSPLLRDDGELTHDAPVSLRELTSSFGRTSLGGQGGQRCFNVWLDLKRIGR